MCSKGLERACKGASPRPGLCPRPETRVPVPLLPWVWPTGFVFKPLPEALTGLLSEQLLGPPNPALETGSRGRRWGPFGVTADWRCVQCWRTCLPADVDGAGTVCADAGCTHASVRKERCGRDNLLLQLWSWVSDWPHLRIKILTPRGVLQTQLLPRCNRKLI